MPLRLPFDRLSRNGSMVLYRFVCCFLSWLGQKSNTQKVAHDRSERPKVSKRCILKHIRNQWCNS